MTEGQPAGHGASVSSARVASAGPGALVSFSAPQADDPRTAADEHIDARRRASILQHELSHARFFTDAAYRAHCRAFWQRLSEPERASWRGCLRQLGYDDGNEELMINEAQALPWIALLPPCGVGTGSV